MRLNQFIARNTGLSRRVADAAIASGRVNVNGRLASVGQAVESTDTVTLDQVTVRLLVESITIMMNKPVGYVCSREGQGSQTIYELLPLELHQLKTVGRLDKDSSGLLLLTNDGQLAYELTHPKFQKTKVYKIALNKPLMPIHLQTITSNGILLEDGLSKLELGRLSGTDDLNWKVTMYEGRNRQIRRTFETLGYSLPKLHRVQFGSYRLNDLTLGHYTPV